MAALPTGVMSFIDLAHRAIALLPALARFAIMMALIIAVPRISRALRIPSVVGLLLSGVLLGPHMLVVFPPDHPVAAFFSDLGMLLLMFFASWEIDLDLFRQKIFRSLTLTQVAATLAAALVATKTFNAVGQPLLDARTFNGVLLMVLVTFVLGPLLVQRFAPVMRAAPDRPAPTPRNHRSPEAPRPE